MTWLVWIAVYWLVGVGLCVLACIDDGKVTLQDVCESILIGLIWPLIVIAAFKRNIRQTGEIILWQRKEKPERTDISV